MEPKTLIAWAVFLDGQMALGDDGRMFWPTRAQAEAASAAAFGLGAVGRTLLSEYDVTDAGSYVVASDEDIRTVLDERGFKKF